MRAGCPLDAPVKSDVLHALTVGEHVRSDPEHLLEQLGGEYVSGRTESDDPARVQNQQEVREPAGQFDIVHRRDSRPSVVYKVAYSCKERKPVVDVEVCRGLVQQQQLGFLRHGLCEEDTLLLTAAQGVDGPSLEAAQIYGFERPYGNLGIVGIERLQPAFSRRPAEHDQIQHPEVEGEGGGRSHKGDSPRKIRSIPGGDFGVAKPQRTGILNQAPGGAKKRRLAGAVGTDQADPRTGRDIESELTKDLARVKVDAKAVRRKKMLCSGHRYIPEIRGNHLCAASFGPVKTSNAIRSTGFSEMRNHRFETLTVLIALLLSSCDSTSSQEEFIKAASSPPSGFTETDASGDVVSEDKDDWRTAPFFVGKVVVDPAYPNPVEAAATVTIPVRILQFEDLSGRISLRVDVRDRFVLLDELLDTSSPGVHIFLFNASVIEDRGLHRLLILDQFSEIISYGDLMIE